MNKFAYISVSVKWHIFSMLNIFWFFLSDKYIFRSGLNWINSDTIPWLLNNNEMHFWESCAKFSFPILTKNNFIFESFISVRYYSVMNIKPESHPHFNNSQNFKASLILIRIFSFLEHELMYMKFNWKCLENDGWMNWHLGNY